MRITMAVAALSIASMTATQPGLAQSTNPDQSQGAVALHDERKDDDGKRNRRKEHGSQRDAILLAARLSALETRVGIREDQLNAWRDYTTALQNLLSAPETKLRATEGTTDGPKDPFDREQKLAERIERRAASAERLKSAIATLRAALSPQQLEVLSSASRVEWLRIPRDAFGKADADRNDKS